MNLHTFMDLIEIGERLNRDIFGIERQFDNFINSSVDYPVMFVYFENILKNKKKFAHFQILNQIHLIIFKVKQKTRKIKIE